METGRVIHRRYLLQRLIKHGQHCTIYQGFDQVLQRAVAVKVPHTEHIPAYRAAIRTTSQFAHPHIIGIYDLIVEPERLYIVQEYVEGDDFETLLQKQLTPVQVIELGMHICQALLYASAPSRGVCHGNLAPGSIIRDHRGDTRVSNFALPADMSYFTLWSSLGGGPAVSDAALPPGQMTDGRRADDTRAVGLLMYQLLASRPAGATSVEPPADGRLHFSRIVPPELCEVVARTVIRQHPQYIATAEALHAELKALAQMLDVPALVVAVAATPLPSSQTEARLRQFSPTPVSSLPQAGRPVTGMLGVGSGGSGTGMLEAGAGNARLSAPLLSPDVPLQASSSFVSTSTLTGSRAQTPAMEHPPASPVVADMSVKLAAARQAAYAVQPGEAAPSRPNLAVLLGLGFTLFALFFVIGYFLAHALFP
ncbi:MAG: protein kinase [Ktedonobacteraceae bacterium]|nr:protein kinase [Ktedonobacteraceae bacterium]